MFTEVCEYRKQVGFLNLESIPCLIVDEARGAENWFQPCRTSNKNQKRIGNFLDVSRQITQDYLRFKELQNIYN